MNFLRAPPFPQELLPLWADPPGTDPPLDKSIEFHARVTLILQAIYTLIADNSIGHFVLRILQLMYISQNRRRQRRKPVALSFILLSSAPVVWAHLRGSESQGTVIFFASQPTTAGWMLYLLTDSITALLQVFLLYQETS
eukprot:TRINITY_DN16278_c0_g1_i4.p1 TRINITY_DN16278_c0_g1~~TRINITY_DN16278_c0_g1_i4.p1  ORF type:complete len:140 (+),score=8.83 TRINITY_DN16278_c0_g1_i4:283-702(+)